MVFSLQMPNYGARKLVVSMQLCDLMHEKTARVISTATAGQILLELKENLQSPLRHETKKRKDPR